MADAADGATERVLELVLSERDRQRAQWGDGPHPDVGPRCEVAALSPRTLADLSHLRAMVEAGKGDPGGAGWWEILLEEVGEVRERVELNADVDLERRTRAQRRRELVQVAAVAVAWLEDLERRDAAEEEDDHG